MAIKRLTRQRKAVLEVIRDTDDHPDAAWIYQEVRRMVPSISLGTVYRTLDTLTEEGYVHLLVRAGEAIRYDGNLHRHYHMICSHCGRIMDVDAPLPDLLAPLRAMHPELEFHAARIEFEGLCVDCKQALSS